MTSISFIAFTRRGCELAKDLSQRLGESGFGDFTMGVVSGPARYADELGIEAYESLAAWTADRFSREDALVYVSATGIAVRAIAPHVRDKFSDPAVVSVDEAGAFVVPLLSGHVGGANDLARSIATVTGGQAVVSTATDVNGLFAVDEWAARNNLAIVERGIAKQVSAALLEGCTVGFFTDEPLSWDVPPGVVPVAHEGASALQGERSGAWAGELGFAVSLDDAIAPFASTLHLVPRVVTVGAGCRKGCDPGVLEQAVDDALRSAGVSRHAVVSLASIDVKREEAALHRLAQQRGWELRFYTADELAAVPGEFNGSDFVKRTVGVDNVCERAALCGGGTLLLGKQARNGTTVAIARSDAPAG